MWNHDDDQGIGVLAAIEQNKGMPAIVENEDPASITTFPAIVTADNVDQYMQFGFSWATAGKRCTHALSGARRPL